MKKKTLRRALRKTGHVLGVVVGAVVLTMLFFLVLPALQAIQSSGGPKDTLVPIEAAPVEPPPPPPPEDEPEEEPEEQEPEPELTPDAAPLDLDQLNLALNAGFGTGFGSGEGLASRLNALAGGGEDGDSPFAMGGLDQKPRPIYQVSPVLSARARKRTPGKVVVVFFVDERGRVQNPSVESSTDPVLEQPAISAVKKWKFEPGKRNGKPVSYPMRVPVTFPKS